jgi:hypothetical protein
MLYCAHVFSPLSLPSSGQRVVETLADPRVLPGSLYQSRIHALQLDHTLILNCSQIHEEKPKEKGGGEQTVRREAERQYLSRLASTLPNPSYSPEQDVTPTQDDYRTRFYDSYHKVAEEYDKEFLKKHDEDLNTTLIFVSPT